MKKVIKRLALIVLSVVAAAGLFACSDGGGSKGSGYGGNAESLASKWDEYEGVKIGFLNEEAYNEGEIKEDKVLPELNCKLGEKQYMIVDFDIQAPHDNNGRETVTASVKIQPSSAAKATIQETNSGNVSEETKDDITEIKATYKIPEKVETVRKMRLVIQVEALKGSKLNIDTSFKDSGGMKPVKTEEIEKSAITGYTDGIEYEELNVGGYTVVGVKNKSVKEIIIPSIYNNKKVCFMEERAFAELSQLEKVVLPDSISLISNRAFYNCQSLESVILSNCDDFKDSCIGMLAFYDCVSLKNISITKSIISIGDEAFSGCSGLTNITVEEGNTEFKSENNCLLTKDGKSLILGCKNSVIPDGVTSIGKNAFRSCSGLIRITIPNSVTSIGGDAFNGCEELTDIVIPNGITKIENGTFYNCAKLTSLTMTSSVMSIGGSAFEGCIGLESIMYDGTKAQWDDIKKGESWAPWDRNTGNYTVHCNDYDLMKRKSD